MAVLTSKAFSYSFDLTLEIFQVDEIFFIHLAMKLVKEAS